jgi:hypothetical protein
MTPEEIQKWISDEAEKQCTPDPLVYDARHSSNIKKEGFIAGATALYNLLAEHGKTFNYGYSEQKQDELYEENQRLKEQMQEKDRQIAGMRKDTDLWSEREKLLEQEIETLKLHITARDEIIERLKGLIEKAWLQGSAITRVKLKTKNYGPDYLEWQQFKTQNNLTTSQERGEQK